MKNKLFFVIKILLFLPLFILYSTFLKPEHNLENQKNTIKDPPFAEYNSQWVDSVFATLSLDQKIGQLFMVAAYSKFGQSHINEIAYMIKNYHIGGIIYFQGGPIQLAHMNNYFQSISKVPIMSAIDGEWGLGMRLDSTISYPRQVMLGAIQDESLIYDMGYEIANQCKRIGININFAPVADVYNNPKNPVIGVRSFGEDKVKVTQKSFAYMIGMQDNNVLATAKHFPGHGDTDTDSHKDLPIIKHTRQRLDSIEMFPFKNLIESGIGGMMVAHLYIPTIEPTPNLASSLSSNFITDILKNELKFKGLIFTDALGMQGITDHFEPGVADLKAFMAGVDILLMSEDVSRAFKLIKQAITEGTITEEVLNQRVKKILRAKQWMGLNTFKPIKIENIYEDLNSEHAKLINIKLVQSAITLVKDENNLLPFTNLEKTKFASVSIGTGELTNFQTTMSLYADVKHFSIKKDAPVSEYNTLIDKLKDYDMIIVGIHDTKMYSYQTFGITKESIDFVANLSKIKKVVLDIYANPHSLNRFYSLDKVNSILISYEDSELSREMSAQLLFGGIYAEGKLPVNVSTTFPLGTGIWHEKVRLKYSIPAELKIDKIELEKEIDSIILGALDTAVFPGCQIMAIKDGVVFYHKSFGYLDSEEKKKANTWNIYDLASLTKVLATTISLMKLYDKDKFLLSDRIAKYIPELWNTNKEEVIIRDILTHQAQLASWIPFYLRTIDNNGKLKKEFYSDTMSPKYNLKVAKNIYMANEYKDSIYKRIYAVKQKEERKYVYSDMGFYLFSKMIDTLAGVTIDKYVNDNFYAPLGAYTLCYNPLTHFNKGVIAPTEDDKVFRKQLLQGYVHDYGAAMLGGVCGHAGLFGNANDIAKVLQMLLQKGYYADRQYIDAATIELFTKKQETNVSGNKRALGFDRCEKGNTGSASYMASEQSYGHTGFTGTMVWVDPKYDFIFIFLSNRINPDINNNKINQMNTRAKVHTALYKAIKKAK